MQQFLVFNKKKWFNWVYKLNAKTLSVMTSLVGVKAKNNTHVIINWTNANK